MSGERSRSRFSKRSYATSGMAFQARWGLSADDLDAYDHVQITVDHALDLLDLRGGNAIAMGCPPTLFEQIPTASDSARSAAYQRAEQLDGICTLTPEWR